MAKSKFFRVATSGATTDGRVIDEQWLHDIAETYDPQTFQARVNLEHIMSAHPDSAFSSYGDVLAVKTEPVTLNVAGKPEQRVGLYAQIDALDPLVDLNKRSQKIFSSIRVEPNFAGSGKAYLHSLAVTDNPASLGTEMLQFCAANPSASPFAARKAGTDHVIVAAEPVSLEFAADDDGDADGSRLLTTLAQAIKGALGFAAAPVATTTAVAPAPAATLPAAPAATPPAAVPAFSAAALLADPAFAALIPLAKDAFSQLQKAGERLAALETAQTDLAAKFDNTPATSFRQRNPATGDNTDRARTNF